jgi:putative endonuclease
MGWEGEPAPAVGDLRNCHDAFGCARQFSRRLEGTPVESPLVLRSRRWAAVVQARDAMSEPQKRFVYVIRSLKDPTRQYVGRTYDIASRLASHNAGESPYTIKHRPWQIVVLVQFLSEQRAAEFQKFLKSASGRAFTKQYFA